jgi:predicted amidohydrolase
LAAPARDENNFMRNFRLENQGLRLPPGRPSTETSPCGRTRNPGHFLATLHVASRWLVAMAAGIASAAAGAPGPDAALVASKRAERLPRKVLLGTFLAGYQIFEKPLEKRLQRMDDVVDGMSGRAASDYPGKQLDMVVFPEYFIARPGDSLAQKTVQMDEVLPRIAACASRHHCYLVVPMLLREDGLPVRYSNAAVLVNRRGLLVGIYRKVHPVASHGSDVMEGGLTPGRDFPVFDCDFGRVGIQICFDMLYPDGWDALARQGAEIVALPSASAETSRPCMYALQHEYYIVSATPRDHAAVFSPLGLVEEQVTEEGAMLVHQIDLSFAEVHWDEVLEEGAALSRRYGQKVGFHFYRPEDKGIFWSNDPNTTIGQMISSVGLETSDSNVERLRLLQDKARGGPPAQP